MSRLIYQTGLGQRVDQQIEVDDPCVGVQRATSWWTASKARGVSILRRLVSLL